MDRVDRLVPKAAALLAAVAVGFLVSVLPRPAFGESASPSAVRRFALVVGAQRSPAGREQDLVYADDDALAMAELLTAAGVDTRVLAMPDPETRQIFVGHVPPQLPPPQHTNLITALQALARDALAAKKADSTARVEALFFFSGHGSAVELHLEGNRSLKGEEIRGHLLTPTLGGGAQPALDAIHLVIDACGVATGAQATSFVDSLKLRDHPHVGILLGKTVAGQTMEWDKIGAGVFSYELRSGLYGGADLADTTFAPSLSQGASPDSAISYRELGAFVATANQAVPPGQARIFPVQQPALNYLDTPVLDWDPTLLGKTYYELTVPSSEERWLRVIDPAAAGVDGSGHPRALILLEVHLGRRHRAPVRLRLPPRPRYFVQRLEQGKVVETLEFAPSPESPSADVTTLTPVAAKGDAAIELQKGLFATPYNEQSILGYQKLSLPGQPNIQYMGLGRKAPDGIQPPAPPPPRPMPPSPKVKSARWPVPCGIALAGGALSALTYVQSERSYDRWKRAKNDDEYSRLQTETRRWDYLTLGGVVATSLATAWCGGTVVETLLRNRKPEVGFGPGRVRLSVRF